MQTFETATKRAIINRTRIPYAKNRYDYYITYIEHNGLFWHLAGFCKKTINSKKAAILEVEKYLNQ